MFFLGQLYLFPLKEEFKDVIGQYEIKSIFKNVDELWNLHSRLLALLCEEEYKPEPQQMIGEVFLQFKNDFNLYNDYCANQQSSMDLIKVLLRENAKFKEFTEEVFQVEESRREDLSNILVKPFQRICRYQLLLKVRNQTTQSSYFVALK